MFFFTPVKKLGSCSMWIRLYCEKDTNTWRWILKKIESQPGWELSVNPCYTSFLSYHFFKALKKKFLCMLWACSRYLRGLSNLVLDPSKKIRVIRHVYRKTSKKVRRYFSAAISILFWKNDSKERYKYDKRRLMTIKYD